MINSSKQKEVSITRVYKTELRQFLLSTDIFLPQSTWELIEEKIQIRIAEKGSSLLSYQQHEHCVRFLTQGVFKILKHAEKECYIFDFREKHSFCSDVNSLFENTPTTFCIETLCDCIWLEILYSDIKFLIKKDNHISRIMNALLNQHISKTQKDSSFFLLNNAKERYLLFCKERPNVCKHASLSEIASYLRITQQSLSRIRKEVSCL